MNTKTFANDLSWMQYALSLASKASELGEVPVGAVLIRDNKIIGEGYNAPISNVDATAHAEIQTIRAACVTENNYRLPGSTLYVTLEPCSMCAGAIIHARIERVVISTKEPRAGAAGSVFNILENNQLNHCCAVQFGLCEQESAAMLRGFFKERR